MKAILRNDTGESNRLEMLMKVYETALPGVMAARAAASWLYSNALRTKELVNSRQCQRLGIQPSDNSVSFPFGIGHGRGAHGPYSSTLEGSMPTRSFSDLAAAFV